MSEERTRYVRIPEYGSEAFETLADLSEEDFRSLEEAIREAQPTIMPPEFAEFVAPKVTLTLEMVKGIIEMLTGLIYVRDSDQLTTSAVIEDAIFALHNSQGGSESLKGKDAILRRRLLALLNLENPLGVITKASQLWVEREPFIRSLRILSDIRPIFGSDAEEGVLAAMIVNTLLIEYTEQNQRRSLSLALDSSDINSLRTALDRAEDKVRALSELLRSASVHLLEG
jgi:hypothetical protein